jgi:hypothetical protein
MSNSVGLLLNAAGVLILVLVGFGIALAIRIIFSRQMQHELAQLKEDIGQRDAELRGMIHMMSGFTFGKLSRAIQPGEIRLDLLRQAIADTAASLEALPTANTKWRLVAENNLAFYLSLEGNEERAKYALDIAMRLFEHYAVERNPEYLNTYAAVVAQFNRHVGRDTLVKAATLLEEMLVSEIAETHKENARRHLERLRRALST